ncbi:MAG: hypothetical protein ACYS0E_14955 [Planctomycetota bacterium]|jgi:hypothetical protein
MRKVGLILALLVAAAGAQEIGEPAPEFACGAWMNTGSGAPSLASLQGKVVLLEFWFST